MQNRTKIIAALMFAGLALPGCDLLKKAASGGTISQADLVNSADRQIKENERNKEKIADLEKTIQEDLTEIEQMRMNGRFSSADYRVKRLNKNLDDLRELDAGNAALTSAPKKLSEIEGTYTEERYQKQVLGDECGKHIEEAKAARMDENWYRVDRRTVDYGKCRRKMVDVGIDSGVVASLDEKALSEYDEYANYLLSQSEAFRKSSEFRKATGFESTLEGLLVYYAEIDPNSSQPKKFLARSTKIQKANRDPKEIEAEKQTAAFEAWKGQVTGAFDKEWEAVQAAESAARPTYDEGMKALDSGDYKTAAAKFAEARQKLYSAAYPSAIALEAAFANGSLEKGLSYEISAGLARTHFEQGDKAQLYPELSIIKNGRKWLAKDQEVQVRMYDILADRNGKLTPKPTDAVRRYAGRYSDVGRQFKGIKEVASAQRGEAYNMLGVDVETISHREAGSNTSEKAGKVVYMKDVAIDTVKGKYLRFDFKSSYKVPTSCRNTKEVASVNIYTGRVSYVQKCKYKTVKDGYVIVVPSPKGVKLKKGDLVSFYATVKERKGKFEVMLKDPGYVRVSKGGETKWFLGATVK